MAETGSKPLEVRVLGPLDVRYRRTPVHLGGPRPRALFATLALNLGRVVPVDRLHDRVWGGEPGPRSAGANLKTYISRMRQQLPKDAIGYSSGGYVLNADLVELDSALFEQRLAEARERATAGELHAALAAVTDALALWRGPVLDGLLQRLDGLRDGAEALLLDEYRLDEMRLQAEAFRVEVLLALGRPEAAVTELLGLTMANPLREEFWEQYMLGLYRSGRTAEALRAFQTCRRTLADEVGLEPSPGLFALERAILADDPSLMAGGRDLGLRGARAMEQQLAGLTETAARARQLQEELRAQAHAAHRAGATWDQIAAAVGQDLLAELLAHLGDVEELRARADTGDAPATVRLAKLLADREDLDELRARADLGDHPAAAWLAQLLAERGDLDDLRVRADAGNALATSWLAQLLAERGNLDELRVRADAGDHDAARQLAVMLVRRGDLDELRARADAGDRWAADQLAAVLAERGDLDELRARADAGDRWAADQLAAVLAKAVTERGDLRTRGEDAHVEQGVRADAGDREVAQRLDGLRVRADAGDVYAARRLAEMLAERGDLAELRVRADAGDVYAARRLVEVLAERGELGELRSRADAGQPWAAYRLAEMLAEPGEVGQLRARADAGDTAAAYRLARVLAEQGDLDELRARADAGDTAAAYRLARVAAEQGDLDELRARADAGDRIAADRLARMLAERGELRVRADDPAPQG